MTSRENNLMNAGCIDLSEGALQMRRAIAEMASTPFWADPSRRVLYTVKKTDAYEVCDEVYLVCKWVFCDEKQKEESKDAGSDFIQQNSPDAVIAMIDEILRLRAENDELRKAVEQADRKNTTPQA